MQCAFLPHARIGPAALPTATPVLLDGLTNADVAMRQCAALTIGLILWPARICLFPHWSRH